MDHEFWHERWRDGRTGFHEGRVNQLLERHVEWLESVSSAREGSGLRVFVPLCGKAEDMAWIAARGHEVVGVELSGLAIEQFFATHGLKPRRAPKGSLVEWSAGPFRLLEGDVFACDETILGPLDAIYDRAATVALPLPMRTDYLRHVVTLMARGARGLLVAFEYDTSRLEGPPFSVSLEDLEAGLEGVTLTALETISSTVGQGSIPCRETCWGLEF